MKTKNMIARLNSNALVTLLLGLTVCGVHAQESEDAANNESVDVVAENAVASSTPQESEEHVTSGDEAVAEKVAEKASSQRTQRL